MKQFSDKPITDKVVTFMGRFLGTTVLRVAGSNFGECKLVAALEKEGLVHFSDAIHQASHHIIMDP